jgi:hypothetical protein
LDGAQLSRNLACLTTSTDGKFELPDLRNGTYFLAASAAGHLPASQRLVIPSPSANEGLTFVLEPGGVLVEGATLDAAGGPVGGAIVTLEPVDSAGEATRGLADSNGHFALFVAPGPIQATALAAGYATASAELIAPASGVSLMLSPGSVIVGRAVEAASETGVAEATVTAMPGNGLLVELPSVQTQADGSFRIEGATAGSYSLSARSPRLRSSARMVHVGVGAQSEQVLLPMTAAIEVAGTVLVGENPCAEGQVVMAGPIGLRERTSPTGTVEFASVWPGNYRVTVTCRGAVPGDFRWSIRDQKEAPAVWRLSAGNTLRGTVTTGSGSPAVGVRVQVISTAAKAAAQCSTGADGAFHCDGLPSGNHRCFVTETGNPLSNVAVVELPSAQPVELKLRPSGTIHAHVKVPLAGLMVVAKAADGVQEVGRAAGGNSFTFSSLALGRYEVSVLGATESVPAQLHYDGQILELNLPASSASLSGQVVDEREQPVVDAWVQAYGAEAFVPTQGTPAVLTDTNGSFTISNIATGRWRVTVTSSSGEATLEGAETGKYQHIRLTSYGSISGTVVSKSGEPVTSFLLAWSGDGQTKTMRVHDRSGRWSLPWLNPGTWMLGVQSATGSTKTNVELPPAGKKEVELRVDRANDTEAAAAFGVPMNWGRDDV